MKKSYVSLVTLIISVVLFIRCETAKEEVLKTELKFETASIILNSDTSWFYQLRDLTTDDKNIIINDFGNNRIISFDMNLKHNKIYGSKGKGPAELLNPTGAIIKNNYLYVADFGNQRFQIFNKNGAIQSSFKSQIFPWSHFCVKNNGNIIAPESGKKYLYSEFNTNGELLNTYGVSFVHKNKLKENNLNTIRVDKDKNDNIYVIFLERCIVQKYSPEGEKLWETDLLKNHKELKKAYEKGQKTKEEPGKENLLMVMAGSTHITAKTLYVLMMYENKEGTYLYGINLDDGQFVNKILIPKKDGYPFSFIMQKNKVIFIDQYQHKIKISEVLH